MKKQLAVSLHTIVISYLLSTKSFMLAVRGGSYAFDIKLVDSSRVAGYAHSSNSSQSPYLLLEQFAKTINLWNNRQESLPLNLTDSFFGEVSISSLRFKMYSKAYFPSTFSTIIFLKGKIMSTFTPSSSMTPVAIFFNELHSWYLI